VSAAATVSYSLNTVSSVAAKTLLFETAIFSQSHEIVKKADYGSGNVGADVDYFGNGNELTIDIGDAYVNPGMQIYLDIENGKWFYRNYDSVNDWSSNRIIGWYLEDEDAPEDPVDNPLIPYTLGELFFDNGFTGTFDEEVDEDDKPGRLENIIDMCLSRIGIVSGTALTTSGGALTLFGTDVPALPAGLCCL